MRRITRMSSIDAAWLRMDRPTNPMVIVSVTILEGRCTAAAVRRLLAVRLLRFGRFRCRPVADALGGWWIPDARFDLREHVGELRLARGAAQAEVERAVGELASTALDASRPRWRFDLVQWPGHGTVLVMRMHHCYADGVALVKTFLGMTSGAADAAPTDVPVDAVELDAARGPGRPSAPRGAPDGESMLAQVGDAATELVTNAARFSEGLLVDAVRAVAQPAATWSAARRSLAEAGGVAGALAALLALPDDPPTPLRGDLGSHRRVAWARPLPLSEVRTAARALGCTINDVLLSLVAGSLGRHLASRGTDVTGLAVRAAVPVNLRPADEPLRLGNRFGLVLVDLPVGLDHPLDRLYAVRAAMRGLKGSRQPAATYTVLNALGAAPEALETLAINVLSRKASAVVSNVPGPRDPLYLCGRRIEQMYFWVPQSGSIGVGISILSYVEQVLFGLVADAGLVPDPHAALDGVAEEFERLRLLLPAGAVPQPAPRSARRPARRRRPSTR